MVVLGGPFVITEHDDAGELIPLKEAQKRLGVSRETLRQLVLKGTSQST